MSKRRDDQSFVGPMLLLVTSVVIVTITILGWDGTKKLLGMMFG